MNMEKKFIITIGRQFGSGGREIGRRLAEMMGIGYYDKALMQEAARESGLCCEFFDKADERAPTTFMHALSMGFGYDGILSNENIFRFQSETIRRLADRESCVIVGRCADYILRDHPACFSVFIHAPEEVRVATVMARSGISERQAAELIAKTDKSRAAYYDFYTDKKWGDAASYHFSINSSWLGREDTAGFIRMLVEKKL